MSGMRTYRVFLPAAIVAWVASSCASTDIDALPESRAGWIGRIIAAENARDVDDRALWASIDQQDPLVRTFGYRALGRLGEEGMLAALFARVRAEPVERARLEGLHALAVCRSPRMVDAAEAFILAGDPQVRAELARGLGLCEDDRAVITLLDLLADPAAEVRTEAALGLARLLSGREDPLAGRPVGAFAALGERMRFDTSAEVRAAAAYAGGVLRRDELRQPLIAAIRDDDPLVRMFACEAVHKLPTQDPAIGLALLGVLGDGDWRVAVEAAKGLADHPTADVLAALAAQLKGAAGAGHASFHVRAAVATSLGSFIGLEGAVVALLPSLHDDSLSVRVAALESVAALAPVEMALDAIGRMLAEEKSPAARGRIAAAAAALDKEAGFGLVIGLLDDPAPGVRAAALAVLPRFPNKAVDALPRVKAALLEPDVAMRDAAAQVALELRLADLPDELRAALADSTGGDMLEARISLLKALAALAGTDAEEDLRRHLVDPERAVRAAARAEIARLGLTIPQLPPSAPPALPVAIDVDADILRDAYPQVILVTRRGRVVLDLLTDEAPVHAALFRQRCRDGFYDGLSFHRLVPGFVLQGLDPRGDGYGTGGTSLRAEPGRRRYDRGMVGMPDSGPDTGGCQLFITFRPQPRLDDRYTLFARVAEGMDVVERLDLGDRVERVELRD